MDIELRKELQQCYRNERTLMRKIMESATLEHRSALEEKLDRLRNWIIDLKLKQ